MTSASASQSERLGFPDGFLWGVATAAHQYEGGNTNNQWYAWEQAGHIHTGEHASDACDWWRDEGEGGHAEHDFDRAAAMGLNALRLSVEWSRVEPRPGEWDDAALARYRRMLRALRDRGIEPMVTLHHFTDPLWFAERGAFLAPDAVQTFTRYATHAAEALGDLCDLWCTINEPNVYAVIGYHVGIFPPGKQGDMRSALRVLGALARAHAAVYRAIHRLQPQARVGWAQNYEIFDPARSRSPLDRLSAAVLDAGYNDVFPRAVRSGDAALPFRRAVGNLRTVRDTADYLGINLYYRDLVRFDPRNPRELFARRSVAPGAPRSDQPAAGSWGEVYPQAIARVARRLAPLRKPIYVTESGVADHDDHLRPWLLATAIRAMYDVLAEGIDLRGYFHWSLVDNFEWAEGWSTRFGLVALDPVTQERTPRPSAELYAQLARANALTPAMLRPFGEAAVRAAFPDGAAG
jgi:beta-glucosidase